MKIGFITIFIILIIFLIGCGQQNIGQDTNKTLEEETEVKIPEDPCERRILDLTNELKTSEKELEDAEDKLRDLVFELQRLKVSDPKNETKKKRNDLLELNEKKKELKFKVKFLKEELKDAKCPGVVKSKEIEESANSSD